MSTDQTTHPDEVDINDEDTAADANVLDDADSDITDSDTTGSDTTDGDGAALPVEKRRSRSATVALAVLVVLCVAAASVAAWLYFSQYRPNQESGPAAAQSALQAAKDGTVALLTYAPDTLDTDLDAAKSHLTGEFLKYYSQFTDQIVRPAAAEKQVETTATVVRAAVSEIHPDRATVLAFVNQTTLSAERPDPELANSSVLINLTKVDGKWLISEFKPV